MAKFILSAFADEASPILDEQIEALKEEQITRIELRGVDHKSCADLTIEDAKRVHEKLSAHGIFLSALGSPYGKIGIKDSFDEHLEKFKRSMEVCKILECDRIRMFSFYLPEGENPADFKNEVIDRIGRFMDVSKPYGISLMHENEKGIYGDVDFRCMELYKAFKGELGVIFDPANYIQCGVDPKCAYDLQKETISYFHMKDALKEDGSVVSVGNGDGSVPEILKDVNARHSGSMILTIEPHLHVFNGLSNLQSDEVKHKESYPDSKTAFHAACAAVKKCLKEMEH